MITIILGLFYSLSTPLLNAQEVSIIKADSLTQVQQEEIQQIKADIAQLKNKNTEDTEIFDPTEFKSIYGLGPVASKSYLAPTQKVIWGLTSDFVSFIDDQQNNTTTTNAAPRTLNQKTALFLGYKLNNKLVFNSQFSFYNSGAEAHAGGSTQTGSAIIENLYLDYEWIKQFRWRIGHQYLPLGISNLNSSLRAYPGVTRPEMEGLIIPNPWHEYGLMLWGELQNFRYHLGVFNSLNAGTSTNINYNANNFVAGGRQNGQNVKLKDVATVGRLDWIYRISTLGFSFFYGNSAQDGDFNQLKVGIWDAHWILRGRRWEILAIYAQGGLGQSTQLPTGSFPQVVDGYSVSIGYNLLSPQHNSWQMWFHISQSNYDLNKSIALATVDPTLKKIRQRLGLNFIFNKHLIFKTGYIFRKNTSHQEQDQFEAGLGIEI